MPNLSIPAHFDGTSVQLDAQVEIRKDARLIVTVLDDPDDERIDFLRFSMNPLARAYEDDEVEYTEEDILK